MVEIITYRTTPWICPPGIYEVTVECWGAGGEGGSINSSVVPNGTHYCAGGGGGGYYSKSLISVTPGASYPLRFGSVTSNLSVSTTFGNDLVSAPSGRSAVGATGGSGTSSSHIYNIVGYVGGAGASGRGTTNGASTERGGGGGGAGSTGNGNNAYIASGEVWPLTGGAAKGDYGGAGGTGGVSGSKDTYGRGNTGRNYGGGGSGSVRANGNTNSTSIQGGLGGEGLFRLTYTDPVIPSTSTSSFLPFF